MCVATECGHIIYIGTNNRRIRRVFRGGATFKDRRGSSSGSLEPGGAWRIRLGQTHANVAVARSVGVLHNHKTTAQALTPLRDVPSQGEIDARVAAGIAAEVQSRPEPPSAAAVRPSATPERPERPSALDIRDAASVAAAASPKEAARVRRGERREQLEARAKAIRAKGEAFLRMGELGAIGSRPVKWCKPGFPILYTILASPRATSPKRP